MKISKSKTRPVSNREAIRVWRWRCEDLVSRYLSPYARHGGLPVARAGLSLLSNRMHRLHGLSPENLHGIDAWKRFHHILHQEITLLMPHLDSLPENQNLCANSNQLDAMQRRLASACMRGKVEDVVDGAITVSLHKPVADNDNDSGFEPLVLGNLVFWRQAAMPEPPVRQSAWFQQN